MLMENNRPTYLIHYGIKGQKKGRRRFQNEDGTLTAEGKERYGIGDDKRAHGSIKKVGNNTDKLLKGRKKGESSTWKSKDASTLSDAELNRRNSRLQREEQYRRMTTSKGKKALKWIAATASTILVASAIEAAKSKMNKNYSKWLHKYGQKYASKASNFARSAKNMASNKLKDSVSIDLTKLRG